MILEGKIIIYKSMTFDDRDIVLEWRNKDRIRKNMFNSEIINYTEHCNWMQSIISDPLKLYFIAYDRKNDNPIGLACLVNINRKLGNCEWAFYIGEDSYLSKGHAIEMEFLILKLVFEELRLHRLGCNVLDFNQPVISFHKKFGFTEEGKYRQYLFRDGRWVDAILLSILENEYMKNKEHIIRMIDRLSKRNQ